MTRREMLGILLAALAVVLGRWLRRRLLVGTDGAWRDPSWLAGYLPPEPPPAESRPAGPQLPTTPLDPNTCPVDSLVLLPGIGPTIAGRIVAARAAGLHFACARDLQAIRGIGPRLSARIEPYLVFAQQDTGSTPGLRSARSN